MRCCGPVIFMLRGREESLMGQVSCLLYPGW